MGAFSESALREASKNSIITRNKSKRFSGSFMNPNSTRSNSNNYRFRETDTRLKKFKDEQKVNILTSKQLQSKASSASSNQQQNKRSRSIPVQSRKRKSINSTDEIKFSKIKIKRINSSISSTNITKKSLDVFEFKDDDEDNILISLKKQKKVQDACPVILRKQKSFQKNKLNKNENNNSKLRRNKSASGSFRIGTNSQGETGTDLDESSHSCESTNFIIDNCSEDKNQNLEENFTKKDE